MAQSRQTKPLAGDAGVEVLARNGKLQAVVEGDGGARDCEAVFSNRAAYKG